MYGKMDEYPGWYANEGKKRWERTIMNKLVYIYMSHGFFTVTVGTTGLPGVYNTFAQAVSAARTEAEGI